MYLHSSFDCDRLNIYVYIINYEPLTLYVIPSLVNNRYRCIVIIIIT